MRDCWRYSFLIDLDEIQSSSFADELVYIFYAFGKHCTFLGVVRQRYGHIRDDRNLGIFRSAIPFC